MNIPHGSVLGIPGKPAHRAASISKGQPSLRLRSFGVSQAEGWGASGSEALRGLRWRRFGVPWADVFAVSRDKSWGLSG